MEHGCGQCLPCRINRRRLWTARLVLESLCHRSSLFVTLTYDNEHLPGDRSVSPRDLKLFLMRLRTALDRPYRYFAVGEYGEKNGRPHYHVLVFGVSECEVVKACWTCGSVHIGNVTDASAAYCTGYCTKGWTQAKEEKLAGRHPEFARMSLKPGIGAPAIRVMAQTVARAGQAYMRENLDVPREVRIAGKKMDIGRYLVNKLRVAVGQPEGCPEVKLAVRQVEFLQRMQVMEEVAKLRARRQADAWRARTLDSITRMKGVL